MAVGLCFTVASSGQWQEPCVDSTRMNIFYPCGGQFQPVCGCDMKTYVSPCAAYNRGGVNQVEHSGVCLHELFFFDFWPNPASDQINFHILLSAGNEYNGSLQVVDIYGNVVYSKLLNNLTGDFPYIETIPTHGYDTGVYFIVVKVGNAIKIKKLVKFGI